MLIGLVQLVNPRRALGLFTLATLVLTAGLYIIFDSYLDSVGKEIVGGWLQSETVAIQEGNLLSSISKNQRILMSSRFIKGVQLTDTSAPDQEPLIEFGESFQPEIDGHLNAGTVTSKRDGFLDRQVLYRVPERPYLVLSFITHSDILTRGFIATVGAFMFFVLLLFISIRKIEARRISAENKNKILLGEVAARVAHDIRSPLNTLNVVIETIHDLSPDSKRLLSTAIQRIREITSGIADQNRLALRESNSLPVFGEEKNAETEATLLLTVIQDLIDEKRAQYPERAPFISWQSMEGCHFAFASVNSSELKRGLSNLIDNAIEASSIDDPISVSMSLANGFIDVEIVDSGRGISPTTLRKIGEKGFSSGKEMGSGLGVYYTRKSVEAWGGKFSIRSELGKGTRVGISLPIATAPSWYIESVPLHGVETIIIIDDDPTIHALWQEQLKHVNPTANVEHFFDLESAMSWIVQNRKALGKYLLLTDYHLNSCIGNGIDVLERLGTPFPNAVMVTSAFDDKSLLDRCRKLNVKILPKPVIISALIPAG